MEGGEEESRRGGEGEEEKRVKDGWRGEGGEKTEVRILEGFLI